ncbi:MAG: hypothetical protein DRJ68_02305 [Thermoprotei archaeon]|nr:MAG: hypothetical protein DRJ62_06660 [Thermoprotei archaeon]RLF21949.1 MAG: hypothetical protein DRJ68_02305 [Thermoprotei archaeon]
MPSVLIASAATSKVLIDGEQVPGVQSIEFKVKRRQVDIESVGSAERIGVECGLITVTGSIRVRSLYKKLDELLYMPVTSSFNMVVELRAGNELIKKITFDECYVDDKSFELGADGVGVTVYNFTATRVREE